MVMINYTNPAVHSSLTVSDKLLITLKYYHEYTTMESIADDYNATVAKIDRNTPFF